MVIVNVQVEYDMKASSSFHVIQKVIKIVQQQVYRMEGSFSKIVPYDGGFSIVCTWGLSPMSHTDDAVRAVLAALNMQKKLSLFFQVVSQVPDFKPPVHFGVSTGPVFMGIVGGSSLDSNRKDILMLGESVERAFRFM